MSLYTYIPFNTTNTVLDFNTFCKYSDDCKNNANQKSYDELIGISELFSIDKDECPCCLEDTSNVCEFDCNHVTCVKCVSSLKTKVCPICRAKPPLAKNAIINGVGTELISSGYTNYTENANAISYHYDELIASGYSNYTQNSILIYDDTNATPRVFLT